MKIINIMKIQNTILHYSGTVINALQNLKLTQVKFTDLPVKFKGTPSINHHWSILIPGKNLAKFSF